MSLFKVLHSLVNHIFDTLSNVVDLLQLDSVPSFVCCIVRIFSPFCKDVEEKAQDHREAVAEIAYEFDGAWAPNLESERCEGIDG